jgi:type II secretory pathway pseudopilin PulG
MKAIIIMSIAVILLSLTAYGCKGKAKQIPNANQATQSQSAEQSEANGYQPSKQVIVEEFQKVWFDTYGTKAEKGNRWRLDNTEVGAIRVDEKAKTATVSIKFIYTPGKKAQRTKTADFLFHEIGGSWTIDKETAKYPINP